MAKPSALAADLVVRAHALLSASGSKKWLNCPPSARLEETFKDEDSEASKEGTKAHDFLEIAAKQRYHGIEPDKALFTEAGRRDAGYTKEMEDAVKHTLELVAEITDKLDAEGTTYTVLVEQKLDYSEWARDGFGTSDITIVTQTRVWVIDFKYGKGVPVDSEQNTQEMLYGLGAYKDLRFAFEDIEEFVLMIVQPRIRNDSSWCVSLADLLSWGEWVKQQAALAWEGKGEFNPGDWCSEGFCKARFTCAARAAANLAVATEEFGDLPKAALLSVEQIAALLPKLSDVAKWAKDIQDHAQKSAIEDGVKYPNWKLVEGKSNRYIPDKKLAQIRLTANGYMASEFMTEPALVGITALEDLVGGKKAFTELLGDIVVKPAGKPTLVPESDKRAVWQGKATADEDFGD